MMQPELTGARRLLHEQSLETARKIAERRQELRQLEADAVLLLKAAAQLQPNPQSLVRKQAEVINLREFGEVRVREISPVSRRTLDGLFNKLPKRFTTAEVMQHASSWEPKRVYNQITQWKIKALILPISRGVYQKV